MPVLRKAAPRARKAAPKKDCLTTEHAEQVKFVWWFRQAYPSVLIFAIPNGGFRSKVTAQKMKMEGVTPGVPDLCIPEWKTYIEMKRVKNSSTSPEQRAIIEQLKGCGYTVEVCKGFEAAKKFVLSLNCDV